MRPDVKIVRYACPMTAEQMRDLFSTINLYQVKSHELKKVAWNETAFTFELVFEAEEASEETDERER